MTAQSVGGQPPFLHDLPDFRDLVAVTADEVGIVPVLVDFPKILTFGSRRRMALRSRLGQITQNQRTLHRAKLFMTTLSERYRFLASSALSVIERLTTKSNCAAQEFA